MEVNPKYNIGQAVYLKQEVAVYNDKSKDNYANFPRPLIIIERLIQECSGGIQYIYRFRMYTDRGTMLVDLNEVELTDKNT